MKNSGLTIIEKAKAKVNLYLEIKEKHDDGYHELDTVFHEVSIHDALKFEKIDKGIEIHSDKEITSSPEDNLVYKAAKLLKDNCGVDKGAGIHITKRIPAGAGLGGGSSDCAAALRGLNRLWELKLTDDELMDLGAKLGADVPFFIKGGIAHGTARGDKLKEIIPLKPLNIPMIIVYPHIHVSTAEAYSKWDLIGLSSLGSGSERMIKSLEEGAFLEICKNLYNDLEPAAFSMHPAILDIKEKLFEKGADGAIMSGSGSAVFGLFETKEKADGCVETMKEYGDVFSGYM